MQFIKRIPEYILLPLGFWLLVSCIYLPAYRAGFYLDFVGLQDIYHNQSFPDFINRAGTNITSLYQVTQFELYCLLKLFGLHPVPWFLLFTGLHALNGYLVYRFFTRFFTRLNYSPNKAVVLIGVLFFLISPVVACVVIWKACFHYLTAVMMMFVILNLTLSYLDSFKSKYAIAASLAYLISIFSLELFYLTPAFVFVTLITLWYSGKLDKPLAIKGLKRVFAPLVGLWLIHLIIFYLVFHKLQAHYGFKPEEVFTFSQVTGKLSKYFVHILFMEYLWPPAYREGFYSVTEQPVFQVVISLLFTAFLLWMSVTFRKRSSSLQIIALLLVMGLLSFVLILPLWFSNIQLMRNDNYYYQPSLFLFLLFAVLIFRIKPRALRYTIVGLYFLISLYGIGRMVLNARRGTKMYWALLNSFRWQNNSTVVLLNLPNNYNGMGMVPAEDPDYLGYVLKYLGKDTIRGKAYDVSSYNVQNLWDGAHVTVIDSMHLKVTLNQWGSWWWYRTMGATSYENELYKLDMADQGHEYHLYFKNKPEDMVILFQQGEQWKEVDMSRIGQEQW